MRLLSVWGLTIILSGCATMMSGPVDIITVRAKSQDIKTVMINGVPFNSPPFSTYVSLEEDIKIEAINIDGTKKEMLMERSINPWGLLNVFNLFLGVAVDYSNGSFWKLKQRDVEI